jgi:hypothetical protein
VKKIANVILVLLYLGYTVGATVYQHYCMGEYVGSSLFNSGEGRCDNCGMKKHAEAGNDCCKDISVAVKTGEDHNFFQASYDISFLLLAIPEPAFITFNTAINLACFAVNYRMLSPPLAKHPRFIQYQNFRI